MLTTTQTRLASARETYDAALAAASQRAAARMRDLAAAMPLDEEGERPVAYREASLVVSEIASGDRQKIIAAFRTRVREILTRIGRP